MGILHTLIGVPSTKCESLKFAMNATGILAVTARAHKAMITDLTLSFVQKHGELRGKQIPRYLSYVIAKIVNTVARDTRCSTNGTSLPVK